MVNEFYFIIPTANVIGFSLILMNQSNELHIR